MAPVGGGITLSAALADSRFGAPWWPTHVEPVKMAGALLPWSGADAPRRGLGTSFAQDWVKNMYGPKAPPPGLPDVGGRAVLPPPPPLPPPSEELPMTGASPKIPEAVREQVEPVLEDFGLHEDADVISREMGASEALSREVVNVMDKVDDEALASRAQLGELTPQIDAFELRGHELEIRRLARDVLAPSALTERLRAALKSIRADSRLLQEDLASPPVAGQPFLKKAHLDRLAADAARASNLLAEAVKPAQRAARRLANMDVAPTPVRVFSDDVQEGARGIATGEAPEPPASTSGGCRCDSSSRCALRGQPFSWCRVPNTCLKDADDPLGTSHSLSKLPPSAEASGEWDYCVPLSAQQLEPNASKVAHFNCRCAPRNDIVERYVHDSDFTKGGKVVIERVPLKDRLTLEAMSQYKGGELCRPTQSSGNFSVCPVAKECSSVGPDTGKGAAGTGGASPSAWFTGVSGRSWDFCVPAKVTLANAGPSEPRKIAAAAKAEREVEKVLEDSVPLPALLGILLRPSCVSTAAFIDSRTRRRVGDSRCGGRKRCGARERWDEFFPEAASLGAPT
eukprot:TRINITY_DN25063_c0_g1_i2.p1 TRINITY_DN25063_c0_g1~~TRINITY_DN25063_c0_g1_i2.p1  ORF type:complete len:579 (+),score=103.16 TRINITY_DN25063_c0_g1_i2:31-1737(+)